MRERERERKEQDEKTGEKIGQQTGEDVAAALHSELCGGNASSRSIAKTSKLRFTCNMVHAAAAAAAASTYG